MDIKLTLTTEQATAMRSGSGQAPSAAPEAAPTKTERARAHESGGAR